MEPTAIPVTPIPTSSPNLEMLDLSVSVSVLINQLFVHSLKADRNAGQVDSDILSISAAFEQLTASIAEITSNAQNAKAASQRVSTNVTKGQNVSGQTLEKTRQIIEIVAEARDRNLELSQAS